MTDFLLYNLKAGLILAILFLFYALFFRKETFYMVNRAYLLAALVISFIIPGLHISMFSSASGQTINQFAYVEDAFFEVEQALDDAEKETANRVNSFPIIPVIIFLGMIAMAAKMGFQLIYIIKNISKYEIKKHGKYVYVLMDKHYTTHSFFNYIFVQKSVFLKNKYKEVLLHEQFHADQWHSFDLLFVGILSILQWFNPFIYLFKRALTETHEFQADQAIIDNGIDKLYYQQLLLKQARLVVFAGLTSNFNQSLIKNRFKMMNTKRSKNSVMLKYAMAFPVLFLMGIIFAVSQERIDKSVESVINATEKPSFATVDLPKDGKMDFSSNNVYSSNENIIRMEGGASITSSDNSLSIKADNIFINKEEGKIYAYTDDYVPSISPLDEKSTFKITSGFGMRMHPVLKKKMMHNGMDFSAETGTPVYATGNGTVREAFHDKNYGNRVIIDHGNGFSTSYSQLQKFDVKNGQSVKQGEIIGYVGSSGLSTGPHLHYEIMKDGKYVDPKDYLNIEIE